MAFLLKKVIKPWNTTKSSSNLTVPEQPMCPPSPDLSHLTSEEISAIHEVIRRQEEFDKQEADRVRRLKEELDGLQQQLALKSIARTQNKKLVDLRLCRLCFKTKFADGVGRVCSDCQQRVCPQCGAFCKPRSTSKRKSMRGRWRCKLCIARREMLCRTGKWYHGTPDPAEGVKKKLSVVCDLDGETDAGSSTCHVNLEDSEACPSGNRTDSELVRRVEGKPASKNAPSGKKYNRRRSLPPESATKDNHSAERSDDDDDDFRDSLDSLILERRLSRRRRQEKKQRRRIRAGQDQRSSESLSDRPRSLYAEGRATSSDRTPSLVKSGERRDSVTRSLWGHSNSLNSCKSGARKPVSLQESRQDNSGGSSTSISSVFSSFRDSSMSDGFNGLSPVVSPPSLKIIRQDALSLNSSCVSITSASEPGRRSYAGSSDPISTRSRESFHSIQHQKVSGGKYEERLSPKALGERSEQKWRQAGFTNVYLVSLQCTQSKEHPYGVKVAGGVQDDFKISTAQVKWVSPEVRSKISVGHEVLEWNGETLRGQTFDYVTSVMTFVYPQVIVIATPPKEKPDSQMICDTPIVITQDRPPSNSPELPGKGGKRRMLPRTPVEIKRGTRQIKGDLKLRLHYQPHIATLAVSVLSVRNITSPSKPESSRSTCFVVISIVPGRRDNFEIEMQTSDSYPEWEQTFLFDGVTLSELVTKALQMTVWCYEEKCDQFVGEVLLDLVQAQLDNQAQWYNLEEHDENSAPLSHRRSSHSASLSASLTSGSFKDSSLFSPAVSPEVPLQRQHQHSPSSVGSTNVSPVPSGTSHVGSREFHLNSVSQPDSFTTKVRKKMRTTVNKMASLSLIEKKDNAGSDESSQSDLIRRSSDKSDKGTPLSRSPNAMKRRQNSYHSMDLLAPPLPPSRTNSSSSFFLSDDEDTHGSVSSAPPDRPPQDGEDANSTLGPGQIPPKLSTEKIVWGNIKLGFMVSKGQLEVDIICAVGLNKSGSSQPPDTYVKTYLVEGKKVIQRKKTLVVKGSFDPVYRKKVKYSACNVHGRIMKIDIWERTSSFEKKSCRGEVLVRLDGLDLSKHTVAWYKLFQMNSTDYGSDEFLSSW
ncbi:regulating synaptic membrane exocytosis protein 1-like isoform X3 [Biomphalaria glabrata]|uniref:Regulating synaptic membrane exocytosis protein 1-like isoform X3 n=1 Tax=Biomphalaria glabrata TaxID=6526 RepID=A0A9W3ABS2_BIOGL|nr:regulating synaptic membrane exocytosis protein 1-like isoform X3 [Biomphalaria glabrata]